MKKLFTVLALVTSLMGCYGAFKDTDIEGTWQTCRFIQSGTVLHTMTFTKTDANTSWTTVNSRGIETTGIVQGEVSVNFQTFFSNDCTGAFDTPEVNDLFPAHYQLPAYYQLKESFFNNQGYFVRRLILLDEQLKHLVFEEIVYRQGNNLYLSDGNSTEVDLKYGWSLVEE